MVLCEFCGYEAMDKIALTFHKRSDRFCIFKQKQKAKSKFYCDLCKKSFTFSEIQIYQHIVECKINYLNLSIETINEKISGMLNNISDITTMLKNEKKEKDMEKEKEINIENDMEKEKEINNIEKEKEIDNEDLENTSKYKTVYIFNIK